jgi:hypothetical protein
MDLDPGEYRDSIDASVNDVRFRTCTRCHGDNISRKRFAIVLNPTERPINPTAYNPKIP